MLYKDIVAGKLDTTGTWATHGQKAVKLYANPKTMSTLIKWYN